MPDMVVPLVRCRVRRRATITATIGTLAGPFPLVGKGKGWGSWISRATSCRTPTSYSSPQGGGERPASGLLQSLLRVSLAFSRWHRDGGRSGRGADRQG